MGTRRNPRRTAAKPIDFAEDNSPPSENPASSSSSSGEEEEEDYDGIVVSKKTQRTSSRTTKFKSSMKEPSGDSIRDLLDGKSEYVSPQKDSSPRHKSPAKSHSSARLRVRRDEDYESSEEEEEEESEDEDEEEESLKIQRILASSSEPRHKWKEICNRMHTSEVEYGSRWFQEHENDEAKLATFEERFLVKWSDLSYMHCSWETQKDLIEQVDGAKKYLRTFFAKSHNGLLFSADERCDGDYFDPAFCQIDRILEVHLPEDTPKKKSKEKSTDNVSPIEEYGIVMDRENPDFESGTGRQFLIKWLNTPYSDCTFEFERDLILNEVDYIEQLKAFEKRSEKPTKGDVRKMHKHGEEERRRSYLLFGDKSTIKEEERDSKVKAYQEELAGQVFPNGGQLRDYQAEGVTWLFSNFINKRSSILTDEMGLGKTIQTAVFVDLVANRLNRRGPFLIVAPLSTITHWYREFTQWTDLNTIVYHGSAEDRQIIREQEMAFECDRPKNPVGFNQVYLRKCMPKSKPSAERQWMAQVVITTPEMLVTDDFVELTAVQWEMLVVDEAHRLKNHNSRLVGNLCDHRFDFLHTLLLTGTPIQNNMAELWTLMNFIDPDEYDDMDRFLERYGDIKSKERIDELHESLRPYILRRLKEDVEKSVPPKEETLIEVELTVLQKQYYRALYEKNVQFLHKNKKKALDGPSLSNLAMQLRKCCNHPFLLRGVEEEIRNQEGTASDKVSEGDFLVKASGKLVLLDKLLPRLKQNGHRVLIFSQFKIMLDIIEDYLTARDMKSERIDGSITGSKRQMAIDRFQSPSVEGRESPFVMLLSTRAGGVGINLTAADTCIIFDSDWNPQNDLQAQARCHRIGQTKSVKVYRLLSRKTYEMQMFHMSSLKMGLDQAVLQGFENGGSSSEGAMTKDEVERLLRHGAYDIFNEEKSGTADAESNDFVQQDIDSILARRSRTVIHDNTGSNSNAAGGTFSKASFKAPKTPEAGQGRAKNDDVDIDDPEFWTKMIGESKLTNSNSDLAGKKRKRMKANYSENDYEKNLNNTLLLSDGESSVSSDSPSDDWSGEDEPESPDSMLQDDQGEAPPKKMQKKKREKARWGGTGPNEWGEKDTESAIRSLQMYGYGNLPWASFMEKMEVDPARLSVHEVKRMCWSMLLCSLREAADEDSTNVKRRSERAAAKKRESDATQSSTAKDSEGGILGADLDALAEQKNSDGQLEMSLRKLVQANKSWLSHVLDDASAFAAAASPRTKNVLDRALQQHVSSTPPKGVMALFVENIWPSLKSRGWTAEVASEGKYCGMTCYVHSGKQYLSPISVLEVAPSIHPELSKTVETILSSVASESQKHAADAPINGGASLSMDSISAASLSSFLDRYAPLQLLVDRAKYRKISIGRKLLGACRALTAAHSLVNRAASLPGPSSVTDKLSNLLSLNKRIALPHPSWTSRHDAVLIRAIARHGWIDHDSCCHAIIEDSSIKWGAPFDNGQEGSNEISATDGTERKHNLVALRNASERASAFFNAENDVIGELKGFNQNLVLKSYGLVKSDESTNPSNSCWVVDDDLLRQTAGEKGTNVLDDSDGGNQSTVEVELPTKKDLLKRAKNVLSRSSLSSEEEATTTIAAAVPSSDHGFSALDQTDPCNIFLAEMLRGLLKIPFGKNSKVKNLAKKLCASALQEAKQRREDAVILSTSNGSDSSPDNQAEELVKIASHIRLVGTSMSANPRLAKNVLRVVLGDTPILPKNPNEPIFPVMGRMELDISGLRGGVTSPNATEKVVSAAAKRTRDDGPTGDRAISRAIARAKDQSKETSGKFSAEADASWLELSAVEALLLSVISSQGLPVWTESWIDLIEENQLRPELQGPGYEKAITWFGMGAVVETAAEVWHKTALSKLQEKQKSMAMAANKEKLLEEIALLEMDEKFKRRAVGHAKDYSADPIKLAKKCVMLLEALRTRMGPVDMKRGGTLKKIKSMNKAEYGLGPLVIAWLGKELNKWAQSLEILDATHRPLGYTAADFVSNAEDDGIGVSAIMEKKGCRAVFGQIAQISRARSVFLRHAKDDMRTLVDKAAKNSRNLDDIWEKKPSWWDSPVDDRVYDHDLLDGLLEYGYSECQLTFSNKDSFTNAAELYADGDGDSAAPNKPLLTKAAVQLRANQLTRELHALEDTADMLRLVGERRARSGTSLTSEKVVSESQEHKEKSGSATGVQTGIQAFFAASKPVHKSPKAPENPVIVITESDGDDEIEVVSPPLSSVSGKRKECQPGEVCESGSAEKRSKVA